MPSSTDWITILEQLIDEVRWGPLLEEGLGYKLLGTTTITAGATVTTNDPEIMRLSTQALTTRLTGWFLYIPSAASADRVRSVTTLDVAVAGAANVATITHAGPNTASGTSTAVYLLRLHPDYLRRLGSDALDELHVRCYVPLFDGPTDADMQASAVTNWTPNAGTPFAKQTTPSEVFEGARSGAFTDAGSGGDNTQSGLINIGTNSNAALRVMAKADVGTGLVSILDASGATIASVSFTQEEWLYMRKNFSGSSSQEQVRVRITGVTASAQLDVQFAGIVKLDSGRFFLPSYLNSRFIPVGVFYADFPTSATEVDTYLASSMDLLLLRRSIDYQIQRSYAAANPYVVRVEPRWLEYQLFFVFDAPWSAPYGVAATFTTDADVTGCPPDLLIAQCKILLGRRHQLSEMPELESIGKNEKVQLERNLMPTDEPVMMSGWAGMFRGPHG